METTKTPAPKCANCGHDLDEYVVVKNGVPQPPNYSHKSAPAFRTTCMDGGKVAIAGHGREKIYCGCTNPQPSPAKPEISYCPSCNCMTHTMKDGMCGKCDVLKKSAAKGAVEKSGHLTGGLQQPSENGGSNPPRAISAPAKSDWEASVDEDGAWITRKGRKPKDYDVSEEINVSCYKDLDKEGNVLGYELLWEAAPAKSDDDETVSVKIGDSLEERIIDALTREADIQKQGGYLDVCNRICFNVIPIVRREFRKEREKEMIE